TAAAVQSTKRLADSSRKFPPRFQGPYRQIETAHQHCRRSGAVRIPDERGSGYAAAAASASSDSADIRGGWASTKKLDALCVWYCAATRSLSARRRASYNTVGIHCTGAGVGANGCHELW